VSDWLDDLPCRIGQIFVAREVDGKIALCHRDDVGREDLLDRNDAQAALEIARYDDAGNYRPLKTAPSLRRGWRLLLADLDAARIAPDYFIFIPAGQLLIVHGAPELW
jgi:sirohydrochlorin cobaltochelatase